MNRLDPRDVKVADVYKAGRRAATLTRDGAVNTFAYLPDYDGPAVATTLPLDSAPVSSGSGAVPAFFANLLPEGRRLTALRQSVKTSGDDELSLLLAVGGDPVGDVQVLPTGVEPSSVEPKTNEPGELDFAELLADQGVSDPSVLAGIQDKVSGRMLTLPLQFGGRDRLLKFEVPEFPRVVENEHFFLERAKRLRHPVVRSQVLHDSRNRSGLLIDRFDRPVKDGSLTSLAVEDGAQLLNIHPAQKYSVTTEALADAVASVCAARPVALRAVFQQVLFAWLTGNGDLHAKNMSVLQHGSEWRVAPIYDIPSTLPYGDHTMALSIGGRRDGLSRKQFDTFGARLGLPRRAIDRTVDEVLAVTERIEEEIADGAIGFDTRRQRDLVRALRRRRRVIAED